MLSVTYPREVARRAEKRRDAAWLRYATDMAYGCTPLSSSCSPTCEDFPDCARRLEAVRKARHDLALREKSRRAGEKSQEKQGFSWDSEPTRLCAPKVIAHVEGSPVKGKVQTFPNFTCKSVSKETEKALLRERRRAMAVTSPGRFERIATQGMTAGRPKPDLWEAPCHLEDGGTRDKKTGKGFKLRGRINYGKDLLFRHDKTYRETLDFLKASRQARADRRAAAVELAVAIGMPEKAREAYRLLRSWSRQTVTAMLTKDLSPVKPMLGRPAPKAPYVKPVKPSREVTPPTTERGKRRAALREARKAGKV